MRESEEHRGTTGTADPSRCPPIRLRPLLSGGRRRRRQSGYVLLLTLLILALAGTVTAGVCRASLARAARSVQAERDLQRRWGAASCGRVYLPQAEQVIAAAEAAQRRPLPAVRARVVLNGQVFDLWFADETAKLNVNVLVHRRGKAAAEAAVKELVRAASSEVRPRLLAGKPQAVRPKKAAKRRDDAGSDTADGGGGAASRPTRLTAKRLGDAAAGRPPDANEEEEENADARPLQSLGQVFPGADPAALAGAGGVPPAAALVSCWGDGRLNFRRAPDGVLKQFGPPTLTSGETLRLLRLRQQSPTAAVGAVLDQMKLDEDARDAIEDRLEVQSNCHSLWVVVTTPERSWYQLAVDDRSGERPGTMTFSW